MKRQNIQFKGMRHSPSDITGQDGDLLECVNLIHENGELKPIEMPERTNLKGELNNEILVAVHNLVDGKKFVFANNTNSGYAYVRIKTENGTIVGFSGNVNYNGAPVNLNTLDFVPIVGEVIQWSEAIGNTLIIGTDKSTHYAFYKSGIYKWLGDKLPQPVFEFDLESVGNDNYSNIYDPNPFGLNGEGNAESGGGMVSTESEMEDGDFYGYAFKFASTTKENKKIFVDNLKAKIAESLAIHSKRGMFVFPFLVRYAVRLFDGKYVMHSAPILMLPSTDVCPMLAMLDVIGETHHGRIEGSGDTGYEYVWYVSRLGNTVVYTYSKSLKYKFVGFKDEDGNDVDVTNWVDIIKGVDIFLSSQIRTYNEDFYSVLDSVPTLYAHSSTLPDLGNSYYNNNKTAISQYFSWINLDEHFSIDIERIDFWNNLHAEVYKHNLINLPSYSKEHVQEKIRNTSLFFQVKRYDLDKLTSAAYFNQTKYLHEEIEYGILERLETLPTLPDDYVSRCRITGNVSYNYNQRLLLGNIKLQVPKWYQDAKSFEKDNITFASIRFVISKPEKDIVVSWYSGFPIDLGKFDFGHYLFYPDPDCKKAYVTTYIYSWSYTGTKYFVVPMHEHPTLHGSYALMPDLKSLIESWEQFEEVNFNDIPDISDDRYYQMPNTIAMSGVANPFYFPASNFKDIGRTKVVGIAANTLDVGFEQWGPFPIAVFCSDGIINVTIDKEGKFGGIDAVSADVLREPRGLSKPTLIQLGQALMFLTQRGVMTMAGTQIKCVSDVMNGRHFNPMRELADVDYHVGAFANLIGRTSDDTDFRDFAASGFLAFDYAHHRVLLLRPDRDYQYVYSMNTGMWSKEIVYTNLESFQIEVVPGNGLPAQRSGGVPLLQVKPMLAAVNNYTEMYLQDEDGWLYKTMEVQGQNSVKQLYQYGYIVSRPIRFGTDEYKTVVNALHRFNHYAKKSFVKLAMYGSRDGVKYGRINSLRGMSYQYFIFVIYTYLKPNERYSYLTVDFETRLANKLR